MPSSGINMDPSLKQFYNDMSLKKTHKYACFKLSEDFAFVVLDESRLGEKANTSSREDDKKYFEKLKESLKPDEPRYIIYDFGFKREDGRDVKEIVFLYWSGMQANRKDKMVYASTKEDVKKCFGISGKHDFQLDDASDMNYDEIADEVLKIKK